METDLKTKKCSTCKVTKTLNEFHKDATVKSDGHRYKCKDCTYEYNVLYNKKNAEKRGQYFREYRNRNREDLCRKEREWYKNNKEHALETKKLYRRIKRKEDPLFRVRNAIARRVKSCLKGAKSKKTMEIVGCDTAFLKVHLESLWQPGMSWDNYGIYGWHIDHIIPLASGKTIKEIEKLCHYTNLQPLWALDNIRKSDKIS